MNPLEITLQDLFGENTQLTANQLIISKADLAKVGLSENPNDWSAIFTAIILNATASFEGVIVDENGDFLVDGSGDRLAYDLDRLSPEISLGLAARYFQEQRILSEYHARFYSG